MSILSKIVPPTNPIPVSSIVVTIYGEPGLGKSTLGNTCDAPLVLDFDRGAHRTKNRRDTLPIVSWADVEELMAEPAALAPYQTIVVDTVGRLLDVLTLRIIQDNSKWGAAGSLSLQGYGVLKGRFSAWLSAVRGLGKDVVLLAHSKEDRRGETAVARPDMQGGSLGEALRWSDLTGFLALRNKVRTLDFNPSDEAHAKNPADWPAFAVPDTSKEPAFLGRLIREAKTAMGRISEESAKVARDMGAWREQLAQGSDVAALNAAIAALPQFPEIVRHQLKPAIVARGRELGLTFDKETREWVKVQAPAAPAPGAPAPAPPEAQPAAAPAAEEQSSPTEPATARQPGEDDDEQAPILPPARTKGSKAA